MQKQPGRSNKVGKKVKGGLNKCSITQTTKWSQNERRTKIKIKKIKRDVNSTVININRHRELNVNVLNLLI